MDAVASRLSGKIGPVVEKEHNVTVLAERPQNLRGAENSHIFRILQAHLQTGHLFGIKGGGEGLAEGDRIKLRRGDKVEPTGAHFRGLFFFTFSSSCG
jgi:hypothetical protein